MANNTKQFHPMLPLDRMVLESIPESGTTFAGLYLLGTPVVSIVSKLKGEGFPVDHDLITARLRSMRHYGLTSPVKQPKQHELGWQRTEDGDKQLKEWS